MGYKTEGWTAIDHHNGHRPVRPYNTADYDSDTVNLQPPTRDNRRFTGTIPYVYPEEMYPVNTLA